MVADGNRRGYEHLLTAFWDEARAFGLPLPTEKPISAASFCTARPKITPALLTHILHDIASTAFEGEKHSVHRWHGRRVFAVDGSKINLQRSPDLQRAFGTPEGAYCPQVLMSILLDVCARFPMDLEVSSFASDEREHLLRMLPSLEAGDVLVLDRGYPAHDVLQALSQAQVDFLIRVPATNTFAAVDELSQSGSRDGVFTIVPPKGSPIDWRPLALRVVRIRTPDGSDAFFLTSLRRPEFTLRQLAELYHMRWEVEEFFKLMKGPFIGQGQFRSKSPAGVRQELNALVLFLAITRVCMAAAAKASGRDSESLSQKAAVLGLAAYVSRIFLTRDRAQALGVLTDLLLRITRARHTKRPGRSSPRVSFRPSRKWGPSGRRGG